MEDEIKTVPEAEATVEVVDIQFRQGHRSLIQNSNHYVIILS